MIEGIPAVLAGVGLLLLFMAAGMPVFVAFLTVNMGATLLVLGPAGFGMFSGSFYETATNSTLVTIPLFILMGELLFRSRAVDVLFQSIDTLIGRVPGRQYVLSIVLATVFSTLSGAAMGVAAMLGRSLLPGMIARGYDARLSVGTILAGASLAPLIPPSVLVIIIGTLAGVSIAGLLIAGIIPGLIFAGLFAAYVFLRIWRNPSLAPQNEEATPRVEFKDTLIAVGRLLPFTIIIVSVMGLILAGVATPTEAGAMGVLGALMTAAIYRNLSFQMVLESLGGSVKISAMILIIMASSKLFSQLLAFSGGASALTAWIVGLDVSPWLMLVLLMVLPFILCMFIDQIALMLIVIPIYLPIIDSFGYDPIWFWLLFLVNITVGGITPPFGYTLFALKSAWSEGSLSTVFAAAWPFVALFILGMIILAVAPGLTTYLPSKL
ncbi:MULTISPECIES: TRAP transporter large permease [Roseobacteraceae]|jgi:tripartite ATP-independent transporter DctM subunit|uniref:TRAP transporter large permease protein n=1 Tax=Sulfitobacter pacificus TaxID=1499314 RepID=A0ABQ5VQI1_9RHOB|nr:MULTISPECIES: TRAP transporter large permease subunit [Roseobacteraceae]MDE4099469.1 TRAP transporter large permease subunit [Phaeobacter gallaeciensis]MDE4108270.1 TRAP transporter large permease subunit [Phaeobacter gallaeciensis]MDE4112974.1 TRAP transporter large permease subunit [Phaeobacter gallaeciensis]MDE4117577.1 TRAP transporter large permease subunit [Phaeobacter gallaeciensis]MDE4121917.1 TRAP transporter large permease subunit [Phaeobacter gallaeciensis]